MACNQNARAASAPKATNKKNKTNRERHAGSFTANTGLALNATPRPAAVLDGVLRVMACLPLNTACDLLMAAAWLRYFLP